MDKEMKVTVTKKFVRLLKDLDKEERKELFRLLELEFNNHIDPDNYTVKPFPQERADIQYADKIDNY